MARPGLQTHPKFKRLVFVLGVPVPHAVGYLECLWNVAYERGSDLIGDGVDVELCSQWPGDRGRLLGALLSCGFVDEDGGKFYVHDLLENAPEYVKKRFDRDIQRKHKYSPRRRKTDGELGGLKNSEKTAEDPEMVISPPNSVISPPNEPIRRNKAELGAPPIPSHPIPSQGENKCAHANPDFDSFWQAYPRKTAKADARKAFDKIRPSPELLDRMLKAIAEQAKCRQWQEGVIPHASTWLNKARWEDEALPTAPSIKDLFKNVKDTP